MASEETESVSKHAPLAYRMRPRTLEEVLGQDHLLGEGKLLRRTILADRLTSLIFYGPPGSGKTTLARIISQVTQAHFVPLNAVASNVGELRGAIEDAGRFLKSQGQRTILLLMKSTASTKPSRTCFFRMSSRATSF